MMLSGVIVSCLKELEVSVKAFAEILRVKAGKFKAVVSVRSQS